MNVQDLIEMEIHRVISATSERVARQTGSSDVPLIMLDLEQRLMQTNRDWFAANIAQDTANG